MANMVGALIMGEPKDIEALAAALMEQRPHGGFVPLVGGRRAVQFDEGVQLMLRPNEELLDLVIAGRDAEVVKAFISETARLPEGPWSALWHKDGAWKQTTLGVRASAWLAVELASRMLRPEPPPEGTHIIREWI